MKTLTLHAQRPSHFYGNAAIHMPFLIFARGKSIKASNVLTASVRAGEEHWRCEREAAPRGSHTPDALPW